MKLVKRNLVLVVFGMLSLFFVQASSVCALPVPTPITCINNSNTSKDATQQLSSVEAGAFTLTGENVTLDEDYTFTGTSGVDGTLTIISSKEIAIKNTNNGATSDRIMVNLPTSINAANITLDGIDIDASEGSNAGVAFEIAHNAVFNVNIKLSDNSKNYLHSAEDCPAIAKEDNKTADDEIAALGTLTISGPAGGASEGNGILQATGGILASGIGGGFRPQGAMPNGRKIHITGGHVTAIAPPMPNQTDQGAFAIGSGLRGAASDIVISGGDVTAYGGIGGDVEAKDITISGGRVTATGMNAKPGIGSYYNGQPQTTDIAITGGIVVATGGVDTWDHGASGIGLSDSGSSARNNSVNGNAVIIALKSKADMDALTGFENDQGKSLLDKGVVFTGLATAFDSNGNATEVTWDQPGVMYGNSVTIPTSVKFPHDFTVESGRTLTVGSNAELTMAEGASLTVENGAQLANDGAISAATEQQISNNGIITTKVDFYLTPDETTAYMSKYQPYKSLNTVQKYQNLPNPDAENTPYTANDIGADSPNTIDKEVQNLSNVAKARNGNYLYWYYINDSGNEVPIDESTDVLLNQHTFYEKTSEPAPIPPGPTPAPIPEPASSGNNPIPLTGDTQDNLLPLITLIGGGLLIVVILRSSRSKRFE